MLWLGFWVRFRVRVDFRVRVGVRSRVNLTLTKTLQLNPNMLSYWECCRNMVMNFFSCPGPRWGLTAPPDPQLEMVGIDHPVEKSFPRHCPRVGYFTSPGMTPDRRDQGLLLSFSVSSERHRDTHD